MQEPTNLDGLLEELEISEIDLKRFVYRSDRFYTHFTCEKKSGGTRDIVAPSPELKRLQRAIAHKFLKKQELNDACTGYRKGMSIVSNAEPHVGQKFVLNIDLKNFFPTVSFKRVLGLFQSMGHERDAAVLLARVTTYKGELPQGAPSSPDIANLVCRNLDNRLSKLCAKQNWHYTRYCDDITISGSTNPAAQLRTITSIIESEGFSVNDDKTRLRRSHQRQTVTGLVVNERVSVPRERKRILRAICHQMLLNPESFRGTADKLIGRLNFTNMVEGLLDKPAFQDSLQRLKARRRIET